MERNGGAEAQELLLLLCVLCVCGLAPVPVSSNPFPAGVLFVHLVAYIAHPPSYPLGPLLATAHVCHRLCPPCSLLLPDGLPAGHRRSLLRYLCLHACMQPASAHSFTRGFIDCPLTFAPPSLSLPPRPLVLTWVLTAPSPLPPYLCLPPPARCGFSTSDGQPLHVHAAPAVCAQPGDHHAAQPGQRGDQAC